MASIADDRVAVVVGELRSAYGTPARPRRMEPVEELVFTILSQNTSDTNTERAWASMRERFPTWDDVLAAPTADLADALRPGGLADQKAPRIQAVLRELLAGPYGLDLPPLARLDPEEALAFLTALPGVGPKTAACVLLFAMDVPVMPVDTHVYRVCGRLGLIGERVSASAAHELITAMTPPELMLDAHLLLIEHGRRTCRALRPRCQDCVLAGTCPSAGLVG